MKKPLIIIFVFIPSIIYGQPILENIEDFSIGKSTTYFITSSNNMQFETKGENIIWDFSQLGVIEDTITQLIVNPESTPFNSDFPKANIVEKNSDGSMIFIEKTDSTNQVWGFITPEKLKIEYLKPYIFIKRPFTYGDSLHSVCTRIYESYNQVYKGKGTSITVSNAYGTLKLPNGIYKNVLLVRFNQIYEDVSQSAGENSVKIKVFSYAWFDKKHTSALFKIDRTIISSPYYNDETENVQYLNTSNPK